jgi:hypothetical protein
MYVLPPVKVTAVIIISITISMHLVTCREWEPRLTRGR